MPLTVPVDSFWFTADSIPFPDIEDEDKAECLINELLAIESVIETEHYAAIRIHTNCELDQLPKVMHQVYEVLAKYECLSPIGVLVYKYKARVITSKHLRVDSLVVFTESSYDWLDMLEDVKKVDARYMLGKSGASHQSFEIFH